MRMLGSLLVGLVFCSSSMTVMAQGKPNEAAKHEPSTEAKHADREPTALLKVQVVIAESEGEKKISSLPYTFYLLVYEHGGPPAKLKVRNQFAFCCRKDGELDHYDEETNFDARAESLSDGKFTLSVSLIRTWWELNGQALAESKPTTAGTTERMDRPTSRTLSTQFDLLIRDGQSMQGITSTDSSTGKVLTVSATVNVVK